MTRYRHIFIILAGIPVFLILTWLLAVPGSLIENQIENALQQSGESGMSLSVNGLKKGVFLTLYADSLDLLMDNKPAVQVTVFSGTFSPQHLAGGDLAFNLEGYIGTGEVRGTVKLPMDGNIRINNAELNAIPYLDRFGIDINGNLSSEINIKSDYVHVVFNIPDLSIGDSESSVIPFLNTFRTMQGALSIRGNDITFDSVSLEGEKGYARLKGNIANGVMNLELELMPLTGKLNTLESMLIGKYIVSPGYYIIPVKGPLL
jgi:type II secretion system protein N